MKYFQTVLMVTALLFFSACSEEEGSEGESSSATGFHFQGRDCLACHNVDLKSEKHLLIGGTLFKDQNVTDALEKSCNAKLVVNFLDDNATKIFSSSDYVQSDERGSKGRGNIFVLEKNLLASGDYIMQITDKNGNELAKSAGLHHFNAEAYSVDTSLNNSNQRSCNACHSMSSGIVSPLYAQQNQNLCN